MGELLDELLNSIPMDYSVDDKVRIICDKIIEEEGINKSISIGPNVFIALPFNDSEFIALEREFVSTFIVSWWVETKSGFTRLQVWQCNEEDPEKIMKFFAKHYKFRKDTTK